MTPANERFEELYERYRDRSLSEQERTELETLMRDPAVRRRFVELSNLDTVLADECRIAASTPVSVRKGPPSQYKRITPFVTALTAAASIALLVTLSYGLSRKSDSKPVAFATITHWQGEPVVRRGDQRLPATAGLELSSGDVILTKSTELVACQLNADGTKIDIHENSNLTLSVKPDSKRLLLDNGALTADVRPQPANAPLLIVTPDSESKIVGTKLWVSIALEKTTLKVHEGHVRMKRLNDNAEVDVKTGSFAVSGRDKAPLTSISIPAVKSFSLINGDTGRPISSYDPISGDGAILVEKLPTRRLFVKPNIAGKVGSIKFEMEGYSVILSRAPFRLNLEYARRLIHLDSRTSVPYRLKATPFSEAEGGGVAGEPCTITGTVVVRR